MARLEPNGLTLKNHSQVLNLILTNDNKIWESFSSHNSHFREKNNTKINYYLHNLNKK